MNVIKNLLYLIDSFLLKFNINLNFYIIFNSQLTHILSLIPNNDNTEIVIINILLITVHQKFFY